MADTLGNYVEGHERRIYDDEYEDGPMGLETGALEVLNTIEAWCELANDDNRGLDLMAVLEKLRSEYG